MKDKDLDKVLWITLNELGIPRNLKGCAYIKSAIKIGIDKPESLNRLMKDVYSPIAEWNGDTVYRVERAMRHAIETGWARGNSEIINKIFGYTIWDQKGRPTVSEFIAQIVEFINLFGDDVLSGEYKF